LETGEFGKKLASPVIKTSFFISSIFN